MKRCARKHRDMDAIRSAIDSILVSDEVPLAARYRDHALGGDMQGKREIHIGGRNSDWLLIYDIAEGIVTLGRTGSHDDLFR